MKRFLTFVLGMLAACWCAGTASAQNTARELATLLKDAKSVEVRRAAASALKYNLQSEGVILDLIDAFRDTDEIVRANAVDAIVLMTPKAAVAPLTQALKSNDPIVRVNAAFSLGRIKRFTGDAIPSLVFMLKDENYDARHAAAEALKRIHNTTREY